MNTFTKTRATLADLVPVEDFLTDVTAGRIQERVHPDDPELRIYSYTKKTQYGGLWTPASKLARGLMLHVPEGDFQKAVVVARGLPKFFTIEQTESDWGRAKLVDDDENVVVEEAPEVPWDAPAVVSEKMNGALGLGYIDPHGKFRISTKGSFESKEAIIANRILETKYADFCKNYAEAQAADYYWSTTPLFEIITPERPHPVDYGELEDLILLGEVHKLSGLWTPAAGSHSSNSPFPKAPRKEVATLREAVNLPYQENTEGFVVTVSNGDPDAIYKVKPVEYLQLRKLFYMLQDSELKEFVVSPSFIRQFDKLQSADNIDFSELTNDLQLNNQMLTMLSKRKQEVFTTVVEPAKELIARLSRNLKRWGQSEFGGNWLQDAPRRDVALWIQSKPKELQGLYFATYTCFLTGRGEKLYKSAILKVLERV